MGEKTAGTGHFQIPAAPAAGTSVTSGAANVYTTTPVQLIASTAAALFITGVHVEAAAASAATYKSVQLMVGAGGSETILGQYNVPLQTGSTVALGWHPIFPPIPVAASARISVKTADSVGAQATLISIECIAQSNVVDDGVVVGTVNLVNTTTTVTNQLAAAVIATAIWQDATAGDFTTASSMGKALYIANVAPGAAGGHFIAGTNAATTITTGLTTTFTGSLTGSVASVTAGVTLAASAVQAVWDALTSALSTVGSIGKLLVTNIDALISGRMATYAQPTGFLAATFPTGTIANTSNITGGTITTTTNMTNAPTVGDLTAAMKSSVTAAVPTVAAIRAEMDSNSTKLANLDATTSSRLATAGYTVPDNVSIAAIKLQSDKMTFTLTNKLDVNVLVVNGVTVTGTGTVIDPWKGA